MTHPTSPTRYDVPPAGDGRGGRHPLAGVPQAALDAAVEALRVAGPADNVYLHVEHDDVEPVAHAVLAAALQAMAARPEPGRPLQPGDRVIAPAGRLRLHGTIVATFGDGTASVGFDTTRVPVDQLVVEDSDTALAELRRRLG